MAKSCRPQSYADFGVGAAEKIQVNDFMSVRQTAAQMVDCTDDIFGDIFGGRSRAFLQVQNGCDHRCTFCVIPYGRGNSRSVPMGAVVEEARRLTEKGFGEIILTGVDLISYGKDLPGAPSLGALVGKILKLVPGVRRLRLSSIDSVEADPLLMRAIAEEERLMPYFHHYAQSGDDMILKRMKRRHSRSDIIDFCDQVRRLRPETAFGADLIAGFPTETEAMFQNSLNLVDDAGLSSLHVFPFSPRPGTPAARMPQLRPGIASERSARLRAKSDAARTARYRAMIGSRQEILAERNARGHTRCFAQVRYDGPSRFAGAVLSPSRITGQRGRPSDRNHHGMRTFGEAPPEPTFFERLKSGLAKSTAGLSGIFTKKKLDAATVAELEEALIRADMGTAQAKALAAAVAKNRYDAEIEGAELRRLLAAEIAAVLQKIQQPLAIGQSDKPFVILVAGVNGTGKTTTIGKLARRLALDGHKVTLAAGDTFRAAAIEQLGVWASRAQAELVSTKPGGDAAGLAYEALEKARAKQADVVIIDTAGRLQNKTGLMAELEKIARVIKKRDASAPHAVLLILDATTGQNILTQVDAFQAAVPLTGLIMTKLDGTAKGGILVALAARSPLPVHFIGVGEGQDDLQPFDAQTFANVLTGAA